MANKENKTIDETKVEEVKTEKVVSRVKKRREIDVNKEVCCRSVVTGLLQYKSDKTGALIQWSDFGTEQWLSVGELIYMNASKPKFLQNPWLIVEDQDTVEYLGLSNIYKNIVDIENLEAFFRLPIKEIREKLTKIPVGFKENIAVKARQMVEDGSLYDIRIIKILEEILKIDLQTVLDLK